MRYSFAAVLALATSVLAQDATGGFAVISKPARDEKVPAGQTYQVTWAPNPQYPGAVTIEIIAGPTNTTLQLVKPPIATGVDGEKGTYDWAVASTLGDQAVYGLKITLESNTTVFQYSLPFQITGGSDKPKDNSTTTTRGSSSSTTTSPPSKSTDETDTDSTKTKTTLDITTTAAATTSATRTPSAPAGRTTSAGAAAPIAGSTLALFGGLAMAIFAL